MESVHDIIIIGASFAGLTVAHGLLRDILPSLKSQGTPYKVTIISPSPYFYWKIGAPRTIVNPSALPVDKALVPIADAFSIYPKEQYEIVQALATRVDPASRIVRTDKDGEYRYNSLVICSGTTFASPLWSLSHGTDQLKAGLEDVHQRLPSAKTVVVAGGGAAGVETAGELGYVYGGRKSISIYSGASQLLGRLQNKAAGKDAETGLKKMGVSVINRVKIQSSTREGDRDVLQLSNGETVTADVYIDATGDKPNASFLPSDWLDDRGFVRVNGQTLELDVQGVTGVFAFGSVGSYSDGGLLHVRFATKPLLESIKLHLQGQAPGPRSKTIYKPIKTDMQFVPMGPDGGVGVVFGWRVPAFLVKMVKSGDFMIGNAPKVVQGNG
ncbi:MAG: hypothetical protein M1821_008370 [Bathelium mastoideum]|nr:MAG: hypothetical protein M1821_008370 [Bathelium mastoideum]KAI9692294.1 MAG: hypothetical protein M1822_006525 [Bathelium mastoideum]